MIEGNLFVIDRNKPSAKGRNYVEFLNDSAEPSKK